MQPHPLAKHFWTKLMVRFEQLRRNLGKSDSNWAKLIRFGQILHPQKHSISYGYVSAYDNRRVSSG